MIKGIMIHDQMCDFYDFLNLHGYKRAHEYHAKCEMKAMRKLHRFFINHYDRLIEEDQIDNPDVIPSAWYRYKRQDVEPNTKRNAVKTGIEKWVAWEQETKDLYERMYAECEEEVARQMIGCLLCDTAKELKYAKRKHLDLVAVDYSIAYIVGQQDHLHDLYRKKMSKHDKY